MLLLVIGNKLLADAGQRYDIIVEANKKVGNYWMRAVPAADCSVNKNADGIRAIVKYQGANDSLEPTTTPYNITDTECKDETGLIPVVPRNVGPLSVGEEEDISVIQDMQDNFIKFAMNGSSLRIDWDNPTLLLAEKSHPSFPLDYDVITLDGTSDTVCSVMTALMAVSIHRCSICWLNCLNSSCMILI